MSSRRVLVDACENCAKPFHGYAGNPNRFCSRKCFGDWKATRPFDNEKTCGRCKRTLPVAEFGQHLRSDRVQGKVYYSTYCLRCRREATPSEQTRRHSLKKRYGITPEQFDEMLTAQGGCASCGSPETNGKYWHIDHDHSCCPSSTRTCGRCIRAILCHGCNTALGNLGDDPRKVEALLNYIRKHNV